VKPTRHGLAQHLAEKLVAPGEEDLDETRTIHETKAEPPDGSEHLEQATHSEIVEHLQKLLEAGDFYVVR
jgi:hypothetical protein